jgi:predicted dehydrogenase
VTLGVGIVGCGLIGHKRAASLPEGCRVVACYDIDANRSAALAANNPGIVVEPTLEALLVREEIGLVVVATTHDMLTPTGLRCVKAGKHVLLEKPGGTNAVSLRALSDAANERGLVVRVGFNHRFHPALLQLRDFVRSGAHGPLMFVRARYGHGGRLGYETEWRADPKRSGGGQLVDQGSHLIDLVRSLFGEVDLAFAEMQQAYWDMQVEDNAFVALRPRAGGFAWLHASWTEWKNLFSLEVMLERAKLEVTGLGGSYGPERLTLYAMQPEMGPPPSTTWEYPPTDQSWQAEMRDVVAHIAAIAPGAPTDWQPIGAGIDDAIALLTLIEEAYRS